MDFILNEVAITRVMSHAKNGFMVVSAFRHNLSLEENLQRHEDMKDALKKEKLGFFELVGYWDETMAPEWDPSKDYPFEESIIFNEINTMDFKINPEYKKRMGKDLDIAHKLHQDSGGDEDTSVEYSLFVPYNTNSGKSYGEFLRFGLFLMDYWSQDGILALDKNKNQVVILSGTPGNRNAHPLGELSLTNISYAYSRLHSDMGRSFMFEGVRVALSNSANMMMHYKGYNLSENKFFINLIKEECATIVEMENMKDVKYIGKNKLPEASMAGGYWFNGWKAVDVSTSTHIKAILENPDTFDMTEEHIKSIYDSYGEPYGLEGKAREDIIKEVARNGWIRVRHYTRPKDYWSLQCDRVKKNIDKLKAFCNWAIDHKLMSYHDEVIILGYDDNEKLVFDFMSGGVVTFLSEKAKDYILNRIEESSWGRIIQHIVSGSSFGVVSAFRGDNPINGWQLDKDNPNFSKLDEQAHLKLKEDIKRMGLGYIEQSSVYKGKEEKSFFVPNIKKEQIMMLGIKYNQQSIIYKDNNSFNIIYTLNFIDDEGSSHKIGDIGMSFRGDKVINAQGRPTITFDPAILKYANSRLNRGSKSQMKQSYAFIQEEASKVTLKEYLILEKLEGLKALKYGKPTEYWHEIAILKKNERS